MIKELKELCCGVVKQATVDYIYCIKHRAAYETKRVCFRNDSRYGCCEDIIREVEASNINNIIELDYEYIFKELDNEYGYYFERYYGSSWVHPWDIIHGNSSISDFL